MLKSISIPLFISHFFSPTLYNKYYVYGINTTFGINVFLIHNKSSNVFNDIDPLSVICGNIYFQCFSSIYSSSSSSFNISFSIFSFFLFIPSIYSISSTSNFPSNSFFIFSFFSSSFSNSTSFCSKESMLYFTYSISSTFHYYDTLYKTYDVPGIIPTSGISLFVISN